MSSLPPVETKGKRGTVVRVLDNDRLVVENVNMVKRHTKPNPARNVPGGIVEKRCRSMFRMSHCSILLRKKRTGRALRCWRTDGRSVTSSPTMRTWTSKVGN